MYWNLFVLSIPCLFSVCQVTNAIKMRHCWNNHKSGIWTTVMKKRQGKFKANLFSQEHFGWRSHPSKCTFINNSLQMCITFFFLLSFLPSFLYFLSSFFFSLKFHFSFPFPLFYFIFLSLFFFLFPPPSSFPPLFFLVLFSSFLPFFFFFFNLEVEWKSSCAADRAQVQQKQKKIEYLCCQHDHLII